MSKYTKRSYVEEAYARAGSWAYTSGKVLDMLVRGWPVTPDAVELLNGHVKEIENLLHAALYPDVWGPDGHLVPRLAADILARIDDQKDEDLPIDILGKT